jgi:hypothetical protein
MSEQTTESAAAARLTEAPHCPHDTEGVGA